MFKNKLSPNQEKLYKTKVKTVQLDYTLDFEKFAVVGGWVWLVCWWLGSQK